MSQGLVSVQTTWEDKLYKMVTSNVFVLLEKFSRQMENAGHHQVNIISYQIWTSHGCNGFGIGSAWVVNLQFGYIKIVFNRIFSLQRISLFNVYNLIYIETRILL